MAVRRGKKSKFKFTLALGIILGVVLVIAVATILLNIPTNKEKITSAYAEVSVTLDEEHVFKEYTVEKAKKKIEKTNGYVFVFFGNPTSEDSKSLIQLLNTNAQNFKIEEIILIDSSFVSNYDRKNNEADDNKLNEIESSLKGVSVDFGTAFWVYKDGALVYDSAKYLNEDGTTMRVDWKRVINDALSYGYEERK